MNALSRAEYFRDRLAVTAGAYRSIDQAKCRALFAQFRGNNTWQVPTLAVLRICGLLNECKLTSDPRLAYVGKDPANAGRNASSRSSASGTTRNISLLAVFFPLTSTSSAPCFALACQ